MSTTDKHTIYIDVDDEITAIIDKVKNAPGRIVALVLPKRATVLQSIVNMKLLKKSAMSAKKSIVLVTSEAGLMPLAGSVGLHVAASLQSKPVIPSQPELDDAEAESITEESAVDEPVIDKSKSVGALAEADLAEDDDTIELDDEAEEKQLDEPTKSSKKKSKKGFKVPNFDRFRLGVFIAILLIIVLVGGWVLAFGVMPKATVAITTDTATNVTKMDFTASTAIQDLNVNTAQVPAMLKEVKKTDTEKTVASAKLDKGTKATGTITVRNCDYPSGFTIPAKSVFTALGKSFINSEDIKVPAFSGLPSLCTLSGSSSGKANIDVTAQSGGESFNIASTQYNVPGAASGAKVDAIGSAMTGGTTNLVTVVGQDDVDAAVAKMKGRLDEGAKKDLQALLLKDSLKSIDETLVISSPVVTSTPAVGAEASGEVSVVAVTTYNVIGVKTNYLNQLVKKDVASKIDLTKQTILDDGLSAAVIKLNNRKSPTEALLSLQSIVISGPQLNADTIKDEIKGKKKGDAQNIISAKPGVKDVNITYSPFWVYSTPNSIKKITVTIQKPVITKSLDTSNNP